MFACRRVLCSTITTRRLHTTPAVLAENEGLFGKFNPWAKKEQQPEPTPAQSTSEAPKVTFDVKYEEAEEIVSWKNTNVLSNEAEIESAVKSVILEQVQGATEANWKELPISDLNTKFQVLKESIKQTGKEVPNYKLNELQNTKDVLEYFKNNEKSVEKTSIRDFFEENAESLPANLKFANRE